MHPLDMVWGRWAPLEKFIPPDRRLLSLLIIVSLLAHGAAMTLISLKAAPRGSSLFINPSVTFLGEGAGDGAGPESLRLSLRLEDPSAIALPRLTPLFAHADPPTAEVAPMAPTTPRELGPANDMLPAGVGGLQAMSSRMPFGRPDFGEVPVDEPAPNDIEGRLVVGSALAGRLLGPAPRLETLRKDTPLEGPTVVSIGVGPGGRVKEAVVVTSCGIPEQDAVALWLVNGLRFAATANPETAWSTVAFHWAVEGLASEEEP